MLHFHVFRLEVHVKCKTWNILEWPRFQEQIRSLLGPRQSFTGRSVCEKRYSFQSQVSSIRFESQWLWGHLRIPPGQQHSTHCVKRYAGGLEPKEGLCLVDALARLSLSESMKRKSNKFKYI